MSASQIPLVSRVLFWILGTALFLTISLLPNLLLAWFYTGGRVHAIVVPITAAIGALIWVTSKFSPGTAG